jgi:hypothetical protein
MAGSNILGNLFGRSPIGPIQEHMRVANQAVQLLPDLLRACSAEDWDTSQGTAQGIGHRPADPRPTPWWGPCWGWASPGVSAP